MSGSIEKDKRDMQMHRYVKAGVESKYTRNEGLLVIPVMGPAGTPPALVRTHAPYGLRQSEFEAVKSGTPPLFPAPVDTGSGDVLLNATLLIPAPTGDQSGLPVFGIRGNYLFVQPLGGRTNGDNFKFDQLPVPVAGMIPGTYDIQVNGDTYIKMIESIYNFDFLATPALSSEALIR